MSRTLPRTASTAPPVLSPDRMITAIGERGNRFLLCVNWLFAFTGSYMITVIAVIGERGERQDIDVCLCDSERVCVMYEGCVREREKRHRESMGYR